MTERVTHKLLLLPLDPVSFVIPTAPRSPVLSHLNNCHCCGVADEPFRYHAAACVPARDKSVEPTRAQTPVELAQRIDELVEQAR